MTRHIPNFITCLNLFAGCIAAVFAFNGELETAAYLVLLAALFDFLDGLAARALNAYSEIGKQLDSLADMVSFGFIPGLFVFKMLSNSLEDNGLNMSLAYTGFIITVFSALRLAKFNIDTRQSENFIGLATPANTMFFISIPFLQNQPIEILHILSNPLVLVFLSLGMSYLLISEIPLFSLKFKSMQVNLNIHRYLLIACSLILIIFFKFAAIPMIIVIYILLSILFKHKFSA
jgi:CDP-diacylglycerol--serine O-phosphatidyltransferase